MGAFYSNYVEPLSAFESCSESDHNVGCSVRTRTTLLLDESLLDIMRFLRRVDLDAAQIANRRLCKLVPELRFVCLRPLQNAFVAKCKNHFTRYSENWFVARIRIERTAPTTRERSSCCGATHEEGDILEGDDNTLRFHSAFTVDVLRWLLTRLQSACVTQFYIENLSCSWPVVKIFQEQACTIFVGKELDLSTISTCSKSWFAVLDSFGGYKGLGARTCLVSHTNDQLIRTALRKGACDLSLSTRKPKYALTYRISEDAILEFCFAERQHAGEITLTVYYPTVTPQFFARLVEASRACRSDAEMHVLVYIDQPHNQDTTAYAGNLKQLHNCQIFDFPGDVHTQVLLYGVQHANYACIELCRAKLEARGTYFFDEF